MGTFDLAEQVKDLRTDIETLDAKVIAQTRVNRATAALPAGTAEAIFTVTGRVKVLSIQGEVTTQIQNQLNNTKLTANPAVGASVDLCAVLDIANDAVGTNYTITGTLADALVETTSGAGAYQAASVFVTAGTIDLDCSAANTGSIKWTIVYEAIDSGATITAA